jgi:hypothetical protein
MATPNPQEMHRPRLAAPVLSVLDGSGKKLLGGDEAVCPQNKRVGGSKSVL